MRRSHAAFTVVASALAAMTGQAQTLTGEALVKALERGGCVIVMRHANSPREAPDAQTANPDNVNRERQLDAEGRTTAISMGKAIRKLKIPIGAVYASPTYRALETVRLAQLGKAIPVPELGDGGRGMQVSTEAQAEWLRKKATEFPTGTDTVLVTHFPNINRAFPQWSAGLADGEALILAPDGKGGAALAARVKIEQWPELAP